MFKQLIKKLFLLFWQAFVLSSDMVCEYAFMITTCVMSSKQKLFTHLEIMEGNMMSYNFSREKCDTNDNQNKSVNPWTRDEKRSSEKGKSYE